MNGKEEGREFASRDNRSMEGRKVERWVNGWIMGQADRRRDQSVN